MGATPETQGTTGPTPDPSAVALFRRMMICRPEAESARLRALAYSDNGWGARHVRVVSNFLVRGPGSPLGLVAPSGYEGAILTMLYGLAQYADAVRASGNDPVGHDHVLGEYWKDSLHAVGGLLDGDTGRLDAGTVSATIGALAAREGFNPDTWDAEHVAGFVPAPDQDQDQS